LPTSAPETRSLTIGPKLVFARTATARKRNLPSQFMLESYLRTSLDDADATQWIPCCTDRAHTKETPCCAGSGAGGGKLSSAMHCAPTWCQPLLLPSVLSFVLISGTPHSDTLILVLHTLLLKGLHCLRSSNRSGDFFGTWISKSSDLKSFNSTSPHRYIGFLVKQ